MCGIAGCLDLRASTPAVTLQSIGAAMSARLAHRGPDDDDIWLDEHAGIVLAHRRLAIVDLSAGGRQPMHDGSGRYVISLNGEVYNHVELRETLSRLGHSFKSTSDVEVALTAITEWGLHEALRRFNGMFAFALWDRRERQLTLVRDRLGEKPLYYGFAGNRLAFASELESLRSAPGFDATVDRDAVALYLRYGYIAAPFSIYKSVRKLPPSCYATFRPGGAADLDPQLTSYWSPGSNPGSEPRTDQEMIDALDHLLHESVRIQKMADVPVGAFLSGGIDSSTVVAVMQRQAATAIKTFSIGFKEAGFDEAPQARLVARHLGTEHHELYMGPEDVLEQVPALPACYGEPFADESQVPTILLSRLARRTVKVAVSGDGGDELFGGYERYRMIPELWKWVDTIGSGRMRALAKTFDAVPGLVNFTGRVSSMVLPSYGRPGPAQDKLRKLQQLLMVSDRPESMYAGLVSRWANPGEIATVAPTGSTELTALARHAALPSAISDRLMRLDLETYLPDNNLVKLDRATMSVGLEPRVPLLDFRIVDFASSLPAGLRTRPGPSKWLLRSVARRYLPDSLLDQPKRGFSVPLAEWLRGPLRDWSEDLLSETSLENEGYVRPELARARWHEHLSGSRNWSASLWTVLMLQAWSVANRSPRETVVSAAVS